MAVTLNQIFELKCLSELEDVSSVALYVGLLAIPLCLLTPVPQYYKLYKRGSAAGFSSMMLLIGNIGRSLNVINLLILHYDQIRLCSSGPGMMIKCQPSLLVLYSGLSGCLSLFPLYFVVSIMNSRRSSALGGSGSSSHRRLWIGLFTQFFIIGLVGSPFIMVIQEGRCAPFQTYANIVGFFNAFFLCAQFLPQIFLTWTQKEGGAISYLTYFPDVLGDVSPTALHLPLVLCVFCRRLTVRHIAGGYIMTVEKAFGTHERISTWMPYALMHTLELIMLILNATFDDSFREWLRHSVRPHRSRYGPLRVMADSDDLDDSASLKRDARDRT